MSKTNLSYEMTTWFSVDTPPVRKGVYNISCRNHDQTGDWYSYWDGEFWHPWDCKSGICSKTAIEDAFENRDSLRKWVNGDHLDKNCTWRGVTFESGYSLD